MRVLKGKGSEHCIVREFAPIHNHWTITLAKIQFLKSHRDVLEGLVAQVRPINKVSIKIADIMSHVALQSGGYNNLLCQLRDIYNMLAVERKTLKLGTNLEGALGYLNYLQAKDPDIYVNFQVDEDNRLSNLFWFDGNSRRDYTLFGEALPLDITYKSNKYNKPLTILMEILGEPTLLNLCLQAGIVI